MIVYKIQNKINNKIYVGKTKQSLNKRIYDHSRSQSHIGNSLRKYGLKYFEISIIDEANSNEILSDKEIEWIKFYNCKYPRGYNLTDGGDGGATVTGNKQSKEHIEKRVKARSWYRPSIETKIKVSNTKKMRSKPKLSQLCKCGCREITKPGNVFIHGHQFKNKCHTEEANKKNSESHKGKVPWNKGLKNCFNEETIKKMSILASHRLGKDRFMYGKHMSEESIDKMKETKRRNKLCRVIPLKQ